VKRKDEAEGEAETRRSEIQRNASAARRGIKIRLIKVGVARPCQDSQAMPEHKLYSLAREIGLPFGP
jgi:hypothetical protein